MSEFAALFPKIYFLRSHLVDKESYHLAEIPSLSQKPPVLFGVSQKLESDLEILMRSVGLIYYYTWGAIVLWFLPEAFNSRSRIVVCRRGSSR